MGKDKGKFVTEPLNVKLPREGKTSLVNCFTTKRTSGWGDVAWGYFLGVTSSLRDAEVGAACQLRPQLYMYGQMGPTSQ